MRLIEKYDKMDVVNPAAIIDTNHSNSGKKYNEQVRIAKEVMNNRQYSSDIKKNGKRSDDRKLYRGRMPESQRACLWKIHYRPMYRLGNHGTSDL